MRTALMAWVLLISCGDDSAPPGNPDAPADAQGGADGGGGTGGAAGMGGAGGAGGMPGDGGPDGAFTPDCGPLPCAPVGTICVDPDGPGPMPAFCGCPNDLFCQGTGHCETSGPNIGRCRCGNGPPCVGGLTICVNNQCMSIDAGSP